MICSWAAATLGAPQAAQAASAVRGSVSLPQSLKNGRKLHGYWRVENGNVPIAPPEGRFDTVVVLAGPEAPAPAAKTVTVELTGVRAVPSTHLVAPGSTIEFKNSDRIDYELSTPEQPSVMPPARLGPGAIRRQKFHVAGAYVVRSSEHPHVVISIIVMDSPYYALADEKGGFKLPDAPQGKATIKIWNGGRWVHEESINVGNGSSDLQIRVPAVGARVEAE